MGLSPHSFRIGPGQRLDLLPEQTQTKKGFRSVHRLDELSVDVSVLAIFQLFNLKKGPAKWLELYSTLLPKIHEKNKSKTIQHPLHNPITKTYLETNKDPICHQKS